MIDNAVSMSVAIQRLGVGRTAIELAIKEGVIKAEKEGRKWVIDASTLKNYRKKIHILR